MCGVAKKILPTGILLSDAVVNRSSRYHHVSMDSYLTLLGKIAAVIAVYKEFGTQHKAINRRAPPSSTPAGPRVVYQFRVKTLRLLGTERLKIATRPGLLRFSPCAPNVASDI